MYIKKGEYGRRSKVYQMQIKERAKDSQRYKKAMDILKKVRYRQKMYRCILEAPLSFPLIVKKEPQVEIGKISTQIKEISREYAADLNIQADYKPTINPVGIKLEDILKWLKGKRVFDTGDNNVKPLQKMSRTYFRDLLRYSILFRIFVDEAASEKYPHITEKIKRI